MEKLIIAGREFESRLFLGTGKFRSNGQMKEEATLVFAGLCAQTSVLSNLLNIRETTEPAQRRGAVP